MGERDRIRWLLRPLGEPAFLRLYLETQPAGALSPRYPRRLFEETFWSLPADLEHPEAAREPAWRSLCEWIDSALPPLGWYHALLRGLRGQQEPRQRDLRDLARFWAAPELFPEPREPRDPAPDLRAGYHEIHCHVRGAVPFLHLWQSWLAHDRARARLRTHVCKAGSWQKTWAELAGQAARIWQAHLDPERSDALTCHAADTAEHLRDVVHAFMTRRDDLRHATGRYLAIYTAARRYFLFQRGQAGLVRFSRAYDRYSKVQKRRGRRSFDQTRRDVAAILRRFHDQGARAVELRPTMDTRRAPFQHKLQSMVLGYFDHIDHVRRQCADTEPVVMGLVPSLYKQEACGEREDDGSGQLWEVQAQVWSRQLDILFAMLDERPALRFFVVGVDAAGRERGCPPRVLAPLMQRVREHSHRHGVAAARPGRAVSARWLRELAATSSRDALERLDRAPVPFIRLGRTVHAGEDFVDPMTGLRHIWETLDACDFGPGDRLGHALAASLSRDHVRELLERRSRESREVIRQAHDTWQLRKPRGVHALDLAWLAQMTPGDDRARWHAELGRLSASLLGVPANPDRLAAYLQAGLHLPVLPAARFQDPARVAAPDCTWHIVDQPWLDMFERMRECVLAEIACRRVVIESCPSSNLAVLGLQTPPIERFIAEDVRCAVATDDPGILDAWPQHEIGFVQRRDRERVLQQNRQASFITRR